MTDSPSFPEIRVRPESSVAASGRRLARVAAGLTTTARETSTLVRTIESLEAAGFERPHLFVDGPLETPAGLPATRRDSSLGGWPNYWLGLTELVARQPGADGFLMVQDDVVFMQGTREFVGRFEIPADAGVLSLFCAVCDNGPFGWHTTEATFGRAGAQGLLFPRERAFEFLAHPWTVNYRRIRMTPSKHFRGDGLHHIDGVVGEWCRRAGLKVYTHSPSLSQHIGHASVMYPGFEGKPDRRFSDSFPGEAANAAELFPRFGANLLAWTQRGEDPLQSISGTLWARIAQHLKPGMRTLETGSGLSTKLFVEAGCRHVSLEDDPAWAERLRQMVPAVGPALQVRPLVGEPPWYHWQTDEPFDLVLIGGPPGSIGRGGLLRVLDRLIHAESVLVVNDLHLQEDRELCDELERRLSWNVVRSGAGHHGFAILCCRENLPGLTAIDELRPV